MERMELYGDDPRFALEFPADEILLTANAFHSREIQREVGYSLSHFGELDSIGRIRESLRTIGDYVKGRRPTGRTLTQEINVPVVELHCPEVAGCKASYESGRETTQSYDISFKVLGLGGGNGATRSFSLINSHELKGQRGGSCEHMLASVEFALSEYQNRNGETFWRGDVSNAGKSIFWYDIPEGDDVCKLAEADVAKSGWPTRRFDLKRSKGTSKHSYSVTRGTKRKISGTVSFDAIGLEFGPSIEVETARKVKFGYSFAPAKSYLAYIPLHHLSYCWSWN